MARSDSLLIGNSAYGVNGNPTALSLDQGGYFGWSPDLANHLSEQAYVRKPLVARVIESPRFFNLMPNPEKWHASFKNLIENKAVRIDGYNAGLEVSHDEHDVGGGGERRQEPIDVKRARSNPSFTFVEKYGRPIQRMLDIWIRYGIMDPESKFAMITTLANGAPVDMLADWWTGTVLVYEPDPTNQRVEKAWLTTNFSPINNGEVTGIRDMAAASELLRLTVPFTGISAYNQGVFAFAEEIMKATSIVNANPFNAAAFVKEISADVRAADVGYAKGISQLVSSVAVPS